MHMKEAPILKDYLEGMTWDNLCKKYNTNLHTLHVIFNKYNVTRKRVQDRSWSEDKCNLLKQMYLDNCTYNEMYKALNCKGGTLTYWIRKLGLPMRGSGRNNIYPNKFIFHTPESDYWLGYILADGHIEYNKKGRHYSVQLCSEKKYVVEKFKEWYDNLPKIYCSNYSLKDGTLKTMYKAELGCYDLAKWFAEELKIPSKKHHTLNPNIDINWDIIRGFFDGDGSASKGEWHIYSCSRVWLERVKVFIDSFNIETRLVPHYLDCFKLCAYKKNEARRIATLMYANNYYCHKYKYDLLNPQKVTSECKQGELLEA